MNTPTDDEIVKHLTEKRNIASPWWDEVYEALRLAREGLPVKDEARELAHDLYLCGDRHKATEIIRTFLAKRDAERDAKVKELRTAAYRVLNWLKGSGYGDKWTTNLSAALAKLERKP